MSKLLEFLAATPVDDISKEVYPSQRFKDEGLQFKITAMSGEEYSKYQKYSTAISKRGKAEFDNKRFNELVIFNHVTEPSFISEENLKKVNCVTPAQFLYRSLLAGEIEGLVKTIMEVSGFNQGIDAMAEEAKN